MDFFNFIVNYPTNFLAAIEDAKVNGPYKDVRPGFYEPFMSYAEIIGFNTAYLIITYLLYQYMQRRDAIPDKFLKPVIAAYNLICVFLAGYVVVGVIKYKLKHPGSFACNETDMTEDGYFLRHIVWVFYAQKFWEFLDTWFFILRKSFRQVTVLHVYHHASISIVIGVLLHFDWISDLYLPIFLNAFVHVLMYFHYFLAIIGIKGWWSKYLTMLQLLQFCLITGQNAYAYYVGPSCGGTTLSKMLLMGYMMTMLFLFSDFFFKRYSKKPTSDQKKVDSKKKK